MSEILNLTLKKEVFDGLADGSNNVVVIEKTNWWKKRLMDIDTGKFKNFTTARISSGSTEKLDYHITGMDYENEKFFIYLDVKPMESEVEQVENDEEVVQETENIPVIEESVEKEEYVPFHTEHREEVLVPVEEDETDVIDYKEIVMSYLESFCGNNDVFVITTPNVMMMPNGRILGCSKQFGKRRYTETKLSFKTVDIVKLNWMTDDEFINEVKDTFASMIKGNYVFIHKKLCGFKKIASGEDCFVLRVNAQKKYIFDRM